MAKKSKSGDSSLLFLAALGVIGFIAFSVFFINTWYVYKKYTGLYPPQKADIRVYDSSSVYQWIGGGIAAFIGLIVFIGFDVALFGNWAASSAYPTIPIIIGTIIGCLIAIFFIFLMIGFSGRIATEQIGVLIFKSKNFFVFPSDNHNNSLAENLLMLKYIKDLCTMEKLRLSDIDKITRRGGKDVFIHGKFGTRCISWRDKQKRDECIAALERGCGRRLSRF